MNLPEKILLGVALGYLAIGGILSLAVGFEDINKSRVSLIGFIDQLADLFAPLKILYLLLWPFWYFAYRASEKKEDQAVFIAYGPDQAKYLKKAPNQPSEPTAPSGRGSP